MKKAIQFTLALVAFATIIAACNKDNGTGTMTVRMKDAPIDFDSVNVEVVAVDIHYSSSSGGNSGWISLPTHAGVYNLLDLQNNVTAVLVNNNVLPAGSITQMRLILGSNNWVVIDSIPFPLELSSQNKTGLKININSDIAAGDSVDVLIDFDAEASIIETGQLNYKLKPVVKLESMIYY